jgi:molybdate transport system substrate-binding protein
VLITVTGCAGGGASSDELVVFAASSLTDVFDEIAGDFEATNPGVDVVINAQGSAQLAAQIEQGAPADVFAAADLASMERVLGDVVGQPATMARNKMVIAVAEGNPAGITGLADLADPELIVVVAAPEVPAGAYAAEVFAAAGVTVQPDSYEQNVRSVAAKVALGEADAGLVYRTDVLADAGRLDALEIDSEVSAEYPIAVMSDDPNAVVFVEFVLGERGQAVLRAAGFEAP